MVTALIIVGAIGIIAGVILALASKFFAVPVDEKAVAIRACLPGANCGACGYAGCDDYAANLAKDPTVSTTKCIPGGDGVAKEIADILGVEAGDVIEMMSVVHCNGNCNNTSYAFDYEGIESCAACKALSGGRGSCPTACLGYGDCVKVCQYNAIHVVNGVAVVDPDACVGCGMCGKACPQHLISMVPQVSHVHVICSNTQKGAQTRKNCKVGCIGCKRCEKECPTGAITVNNNVASIDPDKCVNCGKCMEVCPSKCINAIIPCGGKPITDVMAALNELTAPVTACSGDCATCPSASQE